MIKRKWLDTHVHISATNPDGSARETLAADLRPVLDADDAEISFVISVDGAELSRIGAEPEGQLAGAELVRDLVHQAPSRVYGACMANPRFPDEALRCMDLCLGEWGFVMFGEVLQYMWGIRLDSPETEACVRRAVEFGVPVQVHVSTSMPYQEGKPYGMDHLEDLLRLVERVPDARYIVAHLVGTEIVPPPVDQYFDAIEARFGHWPDNFWCEVRDFNSPGVKSALERVPHTRIIAGTDWTTRVGPPFLPYGMIFGAGSAEANPYPPSVSAMVEYLKGYGADDETVEMIGWSNAAALLGIR
jgi:predicted TIM-barrel fold metal-dependent hydrolase